MNGKWKAGVEGKKEGSKVFDIVEHFARREKNRRTRRRTRTRVIERGNEGEETIETSGWLLVQGGRGGSAATLTNKGCARQEGRNDTWTREQRAKERQLAESHQGAKGEKRGGGGRTHEQTEATNNEREWSLLTSPEELF